MKKPINVTPIDMAIDCVGGLSVLAGLIDESPQTVANWRARGVPAAKCPAIERATSGLVRCEMLNAAVEWGVLRGKSA